MRNILKYLVIAAAVAQCAWAAGTWELVTNAWYDTTQPPTIKLRDCSVDSKGVLWYFVDNRNGLGIHSYNEHTRSICRGLLLKHDKTVVRSYNFHLTR